MDRMPAVDMTATGANILRLRTDRDMTVKDLQTIFGFSTPQAIYNWQQGKDLPTVDNLVILPDGSSSSFCCLYEKIYRKY